MDKRAEMLKLCDRFFDAIENRDPDAIEEIYAPECLVWHSNDCIYQSRESNIAHLKSDMKNSKIEKRYVDRRVMPFEGGFVQQHRIYKTYEDGFVGRMDVCFIAYVVDNKISRIYEYFDTGQRHLFVGPNR